MNMKTDQLIDMLSANLEPVKAGRLGKTLVMAILAGGTGAAVLMLATVGLRSRPSIGSSPRMDGAEDGPSSERDWLGHSISLPLDVSWIGDQNKLAPGVLSICRSYSSGPCNADHRSPRSLDKDAAWGKPDFVSTLFPMHFVLCGDPISSPDLGASGKRTNSVRGFWSACRNRRRRNRSNRLRIQLRQRYDSFHYDLV